MWRVLPAQNNYYSLHDQQRCAITKFNTTFQLIAISQLLEIK